MPGKPGHGGKPGRSGRKPGGPGGPGRPPLTRIVRVSPERYVALQVLGLREAPPVGPDELIEQWIDAARDAARKELR